MATLFFALWASAPVFTGKSFSFEIQDSWVQDRCLGGSLFASVIDDDGDMIAQFMRETTFIANKDHIADFRPTGEGPTDLDSCYGATRIAKNTVAIIDWMGRKIKIFKKENGLYEWQETVHRSPSQNFHTIDDLAFYDNKWFIGGVSVWPNEKNSKDFFHYHILVAERDGRTITHILKSDFNKNTMSRLMRYYLKLHQGKLYFMAEHELKIHVVSPTELKTLTSQRLKPPPFYKFKPKDAYKEQRLNDQEFAETLSKWHTSYSSVTNIALAQGHLIVQLRTATPGKPRFALMFYDLERFELADMLFADDQLVAYKDDLFYFYKDGMPYDDDDAGPFHIDIRRLVAKDQP